MASAAPSLQEIAHAALLEVTPAATVGDHLGDAPRDDAPDGARLVDVRFASTQSGYRGWSWVVTVATVDGEEPTVLELGLLPGEGALVSPEWVPWSVRLAEWQAQQAAAEQASTDDDDDTDDVGDGDDEDDDDTDDDDDDTDDYDDTDDDDDDDDDEDDDDDDLIDPDDEPVGSMREGDIDGVDIDELDDSE